VILESDNEMVIWFVNETAQLPRTYMRTLIWRIKCNINRFRNFIFSHVRRGGIRLAHALAQLAYNVPNQIWMEEVPPYIISLVLLDLIH
jgi:hypothetical protein